MMKLKPKASKTKSIIFTSIFAVDSKYTPKPANRFIPDWYKAMEPSFPKEKRPSSLDTIKKCIPVLDSLTTGYIIVSPCDVYVRFVDGNPEYNPAIRDLIQFHPRKQGYLHPNSNDFAFGKWVNPWCIKTPKGYSCLFIPPTHRPNEWFTILEGVVDTDNYTTPVNFPFILKKTDGEFLIPAGTPIAQVIPFKRDVWKHHLAEDLSEHETVMNNVNIHFFDRYKRFYWNRKSYS